MNKMLLDMWHLKGNSDTILLRVGKTKLKIFLITFFEKNYYINY